MSWSFHVEPGGLVWPDPGSANPQLKEALGDCVESLSPAGTAPDLSTYWIDRLLAQLLGSAPSEAVVASGNLWSLVRHGDTVAVRFEYADEVDDKSETVSVDALTAGLSAYREVVLRAVMDGHQLDERWWAQRNPG